MASIKHTLSNLAEDYAGEAFVEQFLCPICAGNSRVLHGAKNINPDNPYDFDFRICLGCGHGWIDPMPTQGLLSHLYAKGSRSVIGEWGESKLTLPEQICMRRELNRSVGFYLELGVGQGHLYSVFLSRGWKCTGVDPGDWSAKFPGVVRDLADVPSDLSADLVVAFDVLEHVTNPISMLTSLRKFSASNAMLYCAMPNRVSLRAKRDGMNWRMVRPLGHVNYYSKKSIRLAMDATGFRVRFIKVTDLYQIRLPRNRSQIRPALVELFGMGDQLVVAADAI